MPLTFWLVNWLLNLFQLSNYLCNSMEKSPSSEAHSTEIFEAFSALYEVSLLNAVYKTARHLSIFRNVQIQSILSHPFYLRNILIY
jgi:hypothetical protein